MSKTEEHDCAEEFVHDIYGVSFHRCTRKGRYEHEGRWYCKQHHPDTVAKREEERERESNERLAKWDRKWKRESLRDDLEQLAIECADMSVTQYPVSNITRLENIGRQLAKLQEKNHVDEI